MRQVKNDRKNLPHSSYENKKQDEDNEFIDSYFFYSFSYKDKELFSGKGFADVAGIASIIEFLFVILSLDCLSIEQLINIFINSAIMSKELVV